MLDPAVCYCPGLFREVRHSSPEAAIENTATYEIDDFGVRKIITFECPALLSGIDAAVLQGVACELTVTNQSAPIDLTTWTPSGIDEELVNKLLIPGTPPIPGALLRGTLSMQLLLRAAGLTDNGRSTAAARESLERLSCVLVTVRAPSSSTILESYKLLSIVSPTNGQAVHACLNPRLTCHLLNSARQHIRISLVEARKLSTNYAARVLHQRLCAVVSDGATRQLKVGTILEYLYPNDPVMAASDAKRSAHTASYMKVVADPQKLERYRLAMLNKACMAICAKLGWEMALQRQKRNPLETLLEIKRKRSSRTTSEVRRQRALDAAARKKLTPPI